MLFYVVLTSDFKYENNLRFFHVFDWSMEMKEPKFSISEIQNLITQLNLITAEYNAPFNTGQKENIGNMKKHLHKVGRKVLKESTLFLLMLLMNWNKRLAPFDRWRGNRHTA